MHSCILTRKSVKILTKLCPSNLWKDAVANRLEEINLYFNLYTNTKGGKWHVTECANFQTISLISNTIKNMLRIIQPKLLTWKRECQMFQLILEKAKEHYGWCSLDNWENQIIFKKIVNVCFKRPLILLTTSNYGMSLETRVPNISLPLWKICTQIRKPQFEWIIAK